MEIDVGVQSENVTAGTSSQNKEAVNLVKSRWESRESSKDAYEQIWVKNHLYLIGNHYTKVSANSVAPFYVGKPSNRVRHTINFCIKWYELTLAKLLQNAPLLYVSPATSEAEDEGRARLADQLLEYYEYLLDLGVVREKLYSWACETGNAWIYIFWNKNKGRVREVPQMQMQMQDIGEMMDGVEMIQTPINIPVLDEDGNPIVDKIPEGDVDCEVLSPFEVMVDPYSTDGDYEWILVSRLKSIRQLRDMFGEDAVRDIKPEDSDTTFLYHKYMRDLVGVDGKSANTSNSSASLKGDDRLCIVHEYWERVSGRHPEGRYIVVTGDKVLWNTGIPYNHKQIPILHLSYLNINGRVYGMTPLEQAIPMQKDYNRARSQETEDRNNHLVRRLLIPKQSKVEKDNLTDERDVVWTFQPGMRGEEPHYMAPPPYLGQWDNMIARTRRDLEDLLSVHEVSRGIAPGSIKSGVGISMLVGADDRTIYPLTKHMEQLMSKVGRMILQLVDQFVSEERQVKIGGRDSAIEVVKFGAKALKGDNADADYFDVRVIEGSAMPKNPIAKRQEVVQLIQMGVLSSVNPQHSQYITKYLGLGSDKKMMADAKADEQNATLENNMMKQGTRCIPREFENHAIHLAVLNAYRKTLEYRNLPKDIQVAFDDHAGLTEQMMVLGLQKMQMMQQAAMGMPQQSSGGGIKGMEGRSPMAGEVNPENPPEPTAGQVEADQNSIEPPYEGT